MNTIRGTLSRSRYAHNAHLIIEVDDSPLDALIATDETSVTWHRFGLDCSHGRTDVGARVDWFPGLGPYVFATEEYDTMLNVFREHHEVR